ncbi:hypothetical protein [Variovorax sp. GT1P44]|uniref:hypothetical protein n=1 Tax=Variovorax sp. GT1P44 TaxID=3443742 RepID=UPI003F48ED17
MRIITMISAIPYLGFRAAEFARMWGRYPFVEAPPQNPEDPSDIDDTWRLTDAMTPEQRASTVAALRELAAKAAAHASELERRGIGT